MTQNGDFVEIQGTAEKQPYTRKELNLMLDLAHQGINEIIEKQRQILLEPAPQDR